MLRRLLAAALGCAVTSGAAVPPSTAAAGTARCQGHAATIVGTSGADRIAGTKGPDVIVAGGGDDVIRGVRGNDLLCGNAGDDLLRGGRGDDGLAGGGGHERLLGSRGFDLVTYEGAPRGVGVDLRRGTATGHGRDEVESVWWVIGSRFGDRIRGTNQMEIFMPLGGGDRVRGRGGRDLIDGGPGGDSLYGGRAADVLLGQDGADRLDGGRGSDTASFAGADSPVHVDLAAGKASGEGRDALDAVENVEGSPRADTIVGDRRPNTIVGAEGGDLVCPVTEIRRHIAPSVATSSPFR